MDLSFERTTLEGNGLAPALFSFWRYAAAFDEEAEELRDVKFAHDSSIRVRGDIARFSYENRATDPIDGTPTNNTLIVNDRTLTGTCVPVNGCVEEEDGGGLPGRSR